ncbi:DUF3310 domain-containing protein [Listeria seeligeri]|uniref:DUF3310 domain-containing protein n=1 Tax=Listeria seeligeri TaxID=1640 RepID=UPI00289369BE|nr:DUF3310 domain-containing protein [Listeria seeligeri]
MKIYHTETQEDFDELLKKMKKEGYHWWPDKVIKPDDSRLWRYLKQNTVVYVEEEELCYGTLPYAKAEYPNIPIEKYKAKKTETTDPVEKFQTAWKGLIKSRLIEFTDASDNINNPAHYTSGGIETLDYIKAKVADYPSYAVGNILKYVSRYEHKNGLEDLKKAQFYLNDLIKEMESEDA